MGLLLWSIVTKQQPREPEVSYSRFIEAVDEGRVAEATIQGKNIRGRYRGEHGEAGEGFKTFAPEDPDLVKLLREKNVTIDAPRGRRALVLRRPRAVGAHAAP